MPLYSRAWRACMLAHSWACQSHSVCKCTALFQMDGDLRSLLSHQQQCGSALPLPPSLPADCAGEWTPTGIAGAPASAVTCDLTTVGSECTTSCVGDYEGSLTATCVSDGTTAAWTTSSTCTLKRKHLLGLFYSFSSFWCRAINCGVSYIQLLTKLKHCCLHMFLAVTAHLPLVAATDTLTP